MIIKRHFSKKVQKTIICHCIYFEKSGDAFSLKAMITKASPGSEPLSELALVCPRRHSNTLADANIVLETDIIMHFFQFLKCIYKVLSVCFLLLCFDPFIVYICLSILLSFNRNNFV